MSVFPCTPGQLPIDREYVQVRPRAMQCSQGRRPSHFPLRRRQQSHALGVYAFRRLLGPVFVSVPAGLLVPSEDSSLVLVFALGSLAISSPAVGLALTLVLSNILIFDRCLCLQDNEWWDYPSPGPGSMQAVQHRVWSSDSTSPFNIRQGDMELGHQT